MLIEFFIASLGTCGFGIIFNVRGLQLFYSSLGGGLAWIIYSILNQINLSSGVCFFTATTILTIYSELISKYLKTVVTSILIPGLIPLVPGSGIYYTMLAIIEKNPMDAFFKGLDTLSSAGSITIGIIFVSSTVKIFKDLKKKKNDKDLHF